MTDSTANDFFTRKHERLASIASIANIFSWIVLVLQVLYTGARFIQLQNSYMVQAATTGQNPNFVAMLGQTPLYTFSLVADLANIFLRGIVYWLVLKGISLGLNMIVETDLNYKDKFEEAKNEQRPS
jgi:hypothetical protein